MADHPDRSLDDDNRWLPVVQAVREWRDQLIPNTSTGTTKTVRALVTAIEDFDRCTHPRQWHVFKPESLICGYCGKEFVIDDLEDEPGKGQTGQSEATEDHGVDVTDRLERHDGSDHEEH